MSYTIALFGRNIYHPLLGAEFVHKSFDKSSERKYVKYMESMGFSKPRFFAIDFEGESYPLEECLFYPSDESDILVDYHTMMKLINEEDNKWND